MCRAGVESTRHFVEGSDTVNDPEAITSDLGALLGAVRELRGQVDAARLPLELPLRASAERVRTELLAQLDDYVIPRLEALDAPLLAVVGGSTGAGKSTLVNSLVGRQVSKQGVIRPTTRSPVLVHHPEDAAWFTDTRILPSLRRVVGEAGPDSEADASAVRLVPGTSLPAGLALLDAPDIDSVVTSNRELAGQLLAAADLWVFVTSAARYADAVPWDLLRTASARGTAVSVVLDRVPPNAVDEIRPHLAEMLRQQGLGAAPIFPIVESPLDANGLLPQDQTARLHQWLAALARDAKARSVVVRQTLTGALASIGDRVAELSTASQEQVQATGELLGAVDTAYSRAVSDVADGMSDGTLLRGEVLARWQEFVGAGEFIKQVESTVSRVRDRFTAAVTGKPAPAGHLGEALHTGVAALVLSEGHRAVSRVSRAWRGMPGGGDLLDRDPGLAKENSDLGEQVERLVRDWQDDVLNLVRVEGKDRRATAKLMAYGVNGVGVILMLVAFAHGGTLVGAEVGIAGGTAVVGQKLLEAIFGDQAVRTMSEKARASLLDRVQALYAVGGQRYIDAVATVQVRGDQARRLQRAALVVQGAR